MNILIAIPHRGSVDVQLAQFLLHECTKSKNRISVLFEGCNDICRARNSIARRFMDNGHDRLLMSDADTIPPAGATDYMADTGKDIIAGIYFSYNLS